MNSVVSKYLASSVPPCVAKSRLQIRENGYDSFGQNDKSPVYNGASLQLEFTMYPRNGASKVSSLNVPLLNMLRLVEADWKLVQEAVRLVPFANATVSGE
jgi:hypothetical protein